MLDAIKEFFREIYSEELTLNERLFHFFVFVGIGMTSIAAVETAMIAGHPYIVFPIIGFLVALIIFGTKLMRKINTYAAIVAIQFLLSYVLIPVVFFTNGGIQGGAPLWILVAYIFTFMFFRGKALITRIIFVTLTEILLYWIDYCQPQWLHINNQRWVFYVDSAFSGIIVGVGIGLVIYFQRSVFYMERNRTEAQKEEIQKLSNSKERFFASMSHELRTPINSIIGMNEMIRRRSKETEILECSHNINQASHMLLNLVNDILDFSQIELNQMEIHPIEYDTKEAIKDVVDMMAVRVEEKGLEFKVEVDDKLPSVLLGDRKRLQQIILNILTNAVKYTNRGSVTLIVYGEQIDEERVQLTISVADTGIGIKKEDLQFLYDSFKRVDVSKNQKVEGSGLGLNITKQLVDLMGGEIKVDSIYTKGSTFTVCLEQEIVDQREIGNVDFASSFIHDVVEYEAMFTAPEARILVVDDNRMNTMVVTKLLEDTKIQVDVAHSGEEALNETKKKSYHVILMDNRMSGMDGMETTRNIRTQENGLCRNTDVLLCTAEERAKAEQMVEEYGFNGCVTKPIEGKELEKVLMKHIPEEYIEKYEKNDNIEQRSTHFFFNKKKRVLITTDCVADIPENDIKKYGIEVMYLYIKTQEGRYADGKEIDTSNLRQYEQFPNNKVVADSATIEEYEAFFASALTRGDDVIHISMAKNSGKSYRRAIAAAAGFDHVTVVDSGFLSGGQALLTLAAAKRAIAGDSKDKVLASIEHMKKHVDNVFMMPNLNVFYQMGYTNRVMRKFIEIFHCQPVLGTRQSRIRVIGVHRGKQERVWKVFVHKSLNRKNISDEVVLLTHAGCDAAHVELLKKYIQEEMNFKKVIVQRASFSLSCCAGINSIGISFYTK